MFDVSIFDAGFALAGLIAVAAGLLSFLSPCVLPIVPPYLAYMSGISMRELTGATAGGATGAPLPAGPGATAAAVPRRTRAAVTASVFFALGLSTIFLLLGFTASAIGRVFLDNQVLLARISGLVVIGLGLHFLGLYRIPLLDREARLDAGDRGGSALGAYVLGLAFAFGWTPCIGPQLGAILSMAMSEGSLGRGTALLALYALGLGIPFILTALFIERAVGLMNRLKRHMRVIERAMGGLLVLVGLALLTGAFSRFSYWLLETFPALAQLG